MPYDIYGQSLERGHCEVHPHIHEQYPCSLCLSIDRERERDRREEERMSREQAAAYYERQFGDTELDSWLLPESSANQIDSGDRK